MTGTLHCSFCGKNQADVQVLIAAPTCFICDECVDVCTAIVADRAAARQLPAAIYQGRAQPLAFQAKP